MRGHLSLLGFLAAAATACPNEPELELAAGTTRPLPWRLADKRADTYRPYAATVAPQNQLTAEQRVELQNRGDYLGLATASLLARQSTIARSYLDVLDPTDDRESDRAVAELMEGRIETALTRLGRVLRRSPQHPQALWNHALALEALQLPLTSSRAFARIAALNEPGWSGEAHARAKQIGDPAEAWRKRWDQLYGAHQRNMLFNHQPLPSQLIDEFPGSTRLLFYEALRAWPNDQRAGLEEMAKALDRHYGGNSVTDLVERAMSPAAIKYRALQKKYPALVFAWPVPELEVDSFLSEARRLKAIDLAIGMMLSSGRALSRPDEFAKLCKQTTDPWQHFLAERFLSNTELAGHQYTAAEARLVAATKTCAQTTLAFQCGFLEANLATMYTTLQSVTQADPHARRALAYGRAIREPDVQRKALHALGKNEFYRDKLELARAYFHEQMLLDPADSAGIVSYYSHTAMFSLIELDPWKAREELHKIPPLSTPESPLTLLARVDVHRATRDEEEAKLIREKIAEVRKKPAQSEAAAAYTDVIEGRFNFQIGDRSGGVAMSKSAIRRATAAAREDADASKARTLAYSALIIDAASTQNFQDALNLFTEELGLPPSKECALAATIDDERALSIAQRKNGELIPFYTTQRTSRAIDLAALVPAQVRQAFDGCESVAVYARPPLEGRADILPSEIAWSYRSGATKPAASAPPNEQRLIVTSPQPPAWLELAPLSAYASDPSTPTLSGPIATPKRVLEAMAKATEIEIHAHGLVDLAVSDASFLALSPDEVTGRWALTARDVSKSKLRGRPLVILRACSAAEAAPYVLQSWSLPRAFLEAGARAVIASSDPISDGDATDFFNGVRAHIEKGAAVAVRDQRLAEKKRGKTSKWAEKVMVFE